MNEKNKDLILKPIAYISTDFEEKFGLPRQSGRVKALRGTVVPTKEYAVSEAFRGLEDYSHVWLLWGFSLDEQTAFSATVRPPRLGGNKRMGVFATRSPNRPNPIGLSVVELLEIYRGKNGIELAVGGIDLANGTPIYDIKPYLPHADCIPSAKGGFSEAFKDYGLEVSFPEELLLKIPEDKREGLLGVLGEDPRPSYHAVGRSYGMSYAGFEISFYVDEQNVLHVTSLEETRK